jgi:mono/diheme cytochrome c family protein
VARGTSTAAAATPDRGRELFVAKGCVTCHMNRSDREVASRHVVDVGPELTGRTWPAEWLAAKLANPAAFASGAGNGIAMPSLGLSDVEIASLVSFLNRTPLTTAGH